MCPAVKEYAESCTSPHTHAGRTEMFTKGGLLLVITPKFSSVNASSEWPSDSFTVVECSVSPSPWLPYGNAVGFLLGRSFYFYIKHFSLFWRDSFREKSTCTLPQSFKVSHLFWAFCDGEMSCLQSMWCFGWWCKDPGLQGSCGHVGAQRQ